VGSLQNLHAVADAVEQVADVAGAGVEAGGGEEVGRIIERAVELLAGGEAGLRGREQARGILQREQVLTNRRREGDVGERHGNNLSGVRNSSAFLAEPGGTLKANDQ